MSVYDHIDDTNMSISFVCMYDDRIAYFGEANFSLSASVCVCVPVCAIFSCYIIVGRWCGGAEHGALLLARTKHISQAELKTL